VAYAAVATFPLAGAALIAGAMGAKRLVQALGVLITLGLLYPACGSLLVRARTIARSPSASSAARPPILRVASASASARCCAFSSSCY